MAKCIGNLKSWLIRRVHEFMFAVSDSANLQPAAAAVTYSWIGNSYREVVNSLSK